MNAAVLRRLVEETAPRVVGLAVRDVVAPARDFLVLRLNGERRSALGFCTSRALPLLFVMEGDGPDEIEPNGSVPQGLREMRGATLESLEPVEGGRVVVATFRRTDQVGREIERALVVSLDRRPSVSVMDASHASGGSSQGDVDAAADPGEPSLGLRHDDRGRLHVGLPAGDRPWEEERSFETWNEAAVHAATELLPEIVTERRRSELMRIVRRRLRRKRRAISKVEREIAEAARFEEFRHKAQLLLMRKDKIPKGENRVRVLDYDNSTV
ncbi:MAG: hypothetical protein GF400_01730, partial [Candidatus Eisenbacteria bacterium]|nr:hypothetical protein [Candidatus Eisenbacteria bacterium]